MPLSQQLKCDTSCYHARLDQVTVLQNLLSADLTPLQYETTILYFYHCLKAWVAVFKQAERQLNIPAFARIECHLAALETEVSQFNYQLKPAILIPLPEIKSIEHYLGYSYVLTGSQMGARFIIRKLQKSPLKSRYRFNYYQTQSAQAAECWLTWKSSLDQFSKNSAINQQAVINAALACFNQLINWFECRHKVCKVSIYNTE